MHVLDRQNRWVIAQLLHSFASVSCSSADRSRRVLQHTNVLWQFLSEYKRVSVFTLCAATAASVFVSTVAGVLLLIGGVLGMWLRFKRRTSAKISSIERDLPALITVVASSVRASIDPLTAICDADRYFATGSLLVDEIRLLKQRLAAGEDEREALKAFLEEGGSRDVELFKHSILLARKHGSSLAEPLHRIVRVLRQRQSFRRKTRAALAMHRMSAFGIMLCAVFISLMQIVVNASGVRIALGDPRGAWLIGCGALLILVGGIWMTSIGKEETH